MKCPVCKTECGEADKCPSCGFEIDMSFPNRDEEDNRLHCTVMQSIKDYLSCFNVDNDEYYIENSVLEQYRKTSSYLAEIHSGMKIILYGASLLQEIEINRHSWQRDEHRR